MQAAHELEVYNALKDTSDRAAGSAWLGEQNTQPQFMVVGSHVTESELPHVAGEGASVQRAAILNRHFAVKPNSVGGVTGVVQENALKGITGACEQVLKLLKKAGRCAHEFQEFPEGFDAQPSDAAASLHKRSTLLADFEYFAFVPSSWGKENAKAVFSKLPDVAEGVRQRHTFFAKLNEALAKIKPRLIQASGNQGCLTHTFDAGFIDAIMYGIASIERRSVKHAGPEHLRARLAGLIAPFMGGQAISFDFGAFDSSNCLNGDDLRHSMKELIENRIIKDFFGEDATSSSVSRDALEDRCRKFLRSRSPYWLLYTKIYGRESGDRGTSCLNFLVNFVLWLSMMGMESAYRASCQAHPTAAEPLPGDAPWINAFVHAMDFDEKVVERFLRGEKCGFDIIAEGDDGLWLFTAKFIEASPGGKSGMADRFAYWSCMQGTNLEPQDETGLAVGEARVQPCTRRMEHCSRIIVPYWVDVVGKKGDKGKKQRLRVALLPKMRKTVEAADITFGLVPGVDLCERTKLNIGFTKYAACAYNSIDDPLLFNYFFMHARVLLLGDGDPDLSRRLKENMRARFEYSEKNFVHRNMAMAFSGKASNLDAETITEFPVSPLQLLMGLHQRHITSINYPGHCEAMLKAVQIESPQMDYDFIVEMASAMANAGTWTTCGELSGLLKGRLGEV